MKKKLILILAISSISLLFACGKKYYNEWITKDGKQFYYDEKGIMLKNCYSKIGSDTYVFDEEGALVKDSIVKLDGKPSFVDDSGKLKYYGWCSSNGNWYFVNQSILQTGWIKDQGNWYYLDYNGVMQKNEWVDSNYYVDNEGKMVTSRTMTISGKTYVFDTQGNGKEKPDYELLVEKYPNPFWAEETLIKIENLQIDLREEYGNYWLDYNISFQVLDYIYRDSNTCRMNYKIYDENGYIVDRGWLSVSGQVHNDYTKGEKINYRENSHLLKFDKKGTYKLVFESKKKS